MRPRNFCMTLSSRQIQRFWQAGLLLLASAASLASPHEPLDAIQASVAQYLNRFYQEAGPERLEVSVNNLDPRLQLPRCEQPLALKANDSRLAGGHVTVHVRCEGERGWAIYVPAQVAIYRSVPLAARNLARGERVTTADIETRTINISQLRQGHIDDVESLLGMEVRRPINAGEAFRQAALDAPLMVRRGDQVNIELRAGSVSISTAGTAMGNGRLGERIRVRNTQSDRVLTAEVVAAGRVRTAI